MSSAVLEASPATLAPARHSAVRWAALGWALAALILCFAVWPYQHWQFEHRGSVLEGWLKVLSLDSNAEWRFCLAVPLGAAYLAWRRRAALAKLPLTGSAVGLPILVLAMLLYWLGYKVDTGYLGFAALQLSVAGMILLLAGKQWMRELFLPWVFLAFAWPLFPLDNLLAAKLKMPTAQIATGVVSLLGIGVERSGSTLQSTADFAAGLKQGDLFSLDVADSCSGMRSLYALIMVAVLYSIVALRRPGHRVLLALSAIPLAVAGNVVRLILLAVGSMWFGQEWAVGKRVGEHQEESTFHILAGFMVFGVALAGMFALATWLENRRKKKGAAKQSSRKASADSGATSSIGAGTGQVVARGVLMSAIIGGGLFFCWVTPASVTYAEPGFVLDLPAVVGRYHGAEREMSYQERVNFDPGVILKRRLYASDDGREILGTMVVSGSLKKTLHKPEICLPNQGWTITGTQVVPIRLKNGSSFDATLMQVFRDIEVSPGHRMRMKAFHLFWYQGSGGTSTSGYEASHFISYRDAILLNFNHRWSQAAFFMPLPQQEIGNENPIAEVGAMQELLAFVGDAASEFVRTGAADALVTR